MTGCILCATGKSFDVDGFLRSSKWRDNVVVFHFGEKTNIDRMPIRQHSGFQMEISPPDKCNLAAQIEAATKLIQKNQSELQRLKNFNGVELIEVMMGEFWHSGIAAVSIQLPPTLLLLAGQLSIQINVNIYAACD